MIQKEYIAAIRKEYLSPVLNPGDLPNDPVTTFHHWFDFAIEEKVDEVNAMVLSTVDTAARPHSRVVLLKDLTETGLVFFTNYGSHKGQQLSENPFAAVTFFWAAQARQIRIEGKVQKVDAAVSEAYWNSRPRLSQAGAIVSAQSSTIESREALDAKMTELMALPETEVLKRPENWGGFNLVPDYFEFWQGRPGRVHDRIAYRKSEQNWVKSRLSP